MRLLLKANPAAIRQGLAIGGAAPIALRPLMPSIDDARGAALGIAGAAASWQVTGELELPGNAWDACHALVRDGLGASGDAGLVMAEPDLEQSWLPADQQRQAGAAAGGGAPQSDHYPIGAPDGWFADRPYSGLAAARTIVTAVVAMARTLVVETGLPPKKDRLGFFGFGRGFGRGRTRGSLFLAGSASVVGTGCIVGAVNHASFALRLGLSHRGGGGSLGRLLWSHVLWSSFFRDFSLGLFLRRGFHRCFGDRLRRAFGRSPGRLHFSGSGLRAVRRPGNHIGRSRLGGLRRARGFVCRQLRGCCLAGGVVQSFELRLHLGGGLGLGAIAEALEDLFHVVGGGAEDRHHRRRHHEGLAVVEDRRHIARAVPGVAAHGPVGIAGDDVHLAGLQLGEAGIAGERAEFELAGIAEHGGGHGAAEIDVEAGPQPLRIDLREPRQRVAAGADQVPARPYRRQRRPIRRRRLCHRCAAQQEQAEKRR